MIDVVSALRSEVERAAVGFRRLTESDVLRDRGQGKWVKKEILGHLIDSAGMRDVAKNDKVQGRCEAGRLTACPDASSG